jgi:FkbM family methyltransferase
VNIACFALRIFKCCPNTQISPVEAAGDTFAVLEANRRANPSLNWEVLNFGVWRDDELLTLVRREMSMGHRVIKGTGHNIVKGISLEALMYKLGWEQIDVVKMDIEGGEEAVIPAAIDALRRTSYLVIEIHNDRINSRPVLSILQSLFTHHWQLNSRKSKKQLYIMTNDPVDLASEGWKNNF